jgi:hypothetical protein
LPAQLEASLAALLLVIKLKKSEIYCRKEQGCHRETTLRVKRFAFLHVLRGSRA